MSLILRENIGRRLTIIEVDNNFTYLEGLALSGSEGGVSILNYESNNNDTISPTASVIFVSSDSDYSQMNLTLPTPTVGWKYTIIRTDQSNSENYIVINGAFFSGDNSYWLSYSGSNVVMVFDGSVWHILSTNSGA
jgi:hypothetical protein